MGLVARWGRDDVPGFTSARPSSSTTRAEPFHLLAYIIGVRVRCFSPRWGDGARGIWMQVPKSGVRFPEKGGWFLPGVFLGCSGSGSSRDGPVPGH